MERASGATADELFKNKKTRSHFPANIVQYKEILAQEIW